MHRSKQEVNKKHSSELKCRQLSIASIVLQGLGKYIILFSFCQSIIYVKQFDACLVNRYMVE